MTLAELRRFLFVNKGVRSSIDEADLIARPAVAVRPACPQCGRRLRVRQVAVELVERGSIVGLVDLTDVAYAKRTWDGYPPFCTMRCGLRYGIAAYRSRQS